jgi:D-alanyl-D-alanine carboxypeptidase/D-alanyl-D-alanine-endopeptidase (penicillin-binding protein 4)
MPKFCSPKWLVPVVALAAVQSGAQDLDAYLDRPVTRGAIVGAAVSDAAGNLRYSRNADRRMVPASNQKILSCIYALLVFGPEYRGQVRLWKTHDMIHVEAVNHPMLTYAQLVAARETLQVPPGAKLYLKVPYRAGIPPTWEHDDLPNRYAAQPSAFAVDRGGFELWNQGGKPAFRPANYGVQTQPGRKLRYDPLRGVAWVPSGLPKAIERLDSLAVPDPERAAALALGAKLTAPVASVPSGSPDLLLEAPPLREIVRECLVRSDNFLAECLMLNAAAVEAPFTDPEDPYAEAADRMKKRLVAVAGIDPDDLRPIDGSGLSRHNLVTPRVLIQLLLFADRTWPEWRSWLAGPGEGTLTNRLVGVNFRGKTGSLSSVSSLSGLSTGPTGESLAIALVFNHFVVSATQIRALQDEIVAKIGAPGGTDLEVDKGHDPERSYPHTSDLVVHRNRLGRLGGHSGSARSGSDRRAQSADACVHRAERVALRFGEGADAGRRVAGPCLVCAVQSAFR